MTNRCEFQKEENENYSFLVIVFSAVFYVLFLLHCFDTNEGFRTINKRLDKIEIAK